MKHKYAMLALVVFVILAGSLFYVRAENEKYHHHAETDSGKLVGQTVDEEHFPNEDSRLWVYGNANEDDRIDENDVAYLERVIQGNEKATQLCDANLDGAIDGSDVTHVRSMILGNMMDVYYIDNYFLNAKVSWPVKSIAIGYCSGAYTADVTGLCDKVDMVDTTIERYWAGMNSNFGNAESYGTTESPNYEKMLSCRIDVYVVGYCDKEADRISNSKLNPAGVDVMFVSTADNSGVDYPNEHIDRSILMFAYLLQGDMEKAYKYLDWHDSILNKLKDITSSLTEDEKEAFIMARSSPHYSTGGISITGKDNTNNIHAEWVGVHAVGQHSPVLSKNYQTLSPEQLLTVIKDNSKHNRLFYMDNEHDGMRGQYSLKECIEADREMLGSSSVNIHYLGMAREAGNSPVYVVELAFYVCAMYPEIAEEAGIDYKELFGYYFDTFSSEDYSTMVSDIEKFFYMA